MSEFLKIKISDRISLREIHKYLGFGQWSLAKIPLTFLRKNVDYVVTEEKIPNRMQLREQVYLTREGFYRYVVHSNTKKAKRYMLTFLKNERTTITK